MRALSYLIVLLLSAGTAYSQLKPGTYSFSGGFVGRTLKIRHKNRFVYYDWSCTHSLMGFGSYNIQKDTLILVFHNPPSAKGLKPVISKEPGTDSTQFFLQFGFGSLEPEKEPEIIIRINAGGKNIANAIAENKTTKITVPNHALPVNLEFSSGYSRDSLQLSEPGIYHILYPIEDRRTHYKKSGETMMFKLAGASRKQIHLKSITQDEQAFSLSRKPRGFNRLFVRLKKMHKRP